MRRTFVSSLPRQLACHFTVHDPPSRRTGRQLHPDGRTDEGYRIHRHRRRRDRSIPSVHRHHLMVNDIAQNNERETTVHLVHQ